MEERNLGEKEALLGLISNVFLNQKQQEVQKGQKSKMSVSPRRELNFQSFQARLWASEAMKNRL